jgi:hypothetical protein
VRELVFLLEERSARAMLDASVSFRLIPFEGKQDLEKQLVRRIRHQASRKFRTPDRLGSPSQELQTLTRHRYEKVAGSRAIGACLNPDHNRSVSFCNLMAAVRRMEQELLALNPPEAA